MKKLLCSAVILLSIPCFSYPEVTQEHKDRAAEIVSRMTLDEKIEYVAGNELWYIRAVDRLGLPAVRMADGPQGVRNNIKSTLYPSGVAAAATWDKSLINQMGVALGQDGFDRTFELPQKQMEYLYKVLDYNKNVVVVLNAGGGVEMASWIHDVKAVLMAWYPGQQGGLAVSEIITGKVNPSGKLPISIEAVQEDNPVFENYHENVSRIRRAEVAQLYVTDEQCSLVRPAKELKGFEKVYLEPGQTKTVSIRLDDEAFRFYSPVKHDWVVEPGRFIVSVGASSADIRLQDELTIK